MGQLSQSVTDEQEKYKIYVRSIGEFLRASRALVWLLTRVNTRVPLQANNLVSVTSQQTTHTHTHTQTHTQTHTHTHTHARKCRPAHLSVDTIAYFKSGFLSKSFVTNPTGKWLYS